MGEGREDRRPRATKNARRGRGGKQVRPPRELRAAITRTRARRRWPGPLSARFGPAPGPPPLPHPPRALPHPLTRRRLRPPPSRGRGPAAARALRSFEAWSRHLALPVRPPQPTATPPPFLSGRSGFRLRHSHPAWAALHVSTTKCVSTQPRAPQGPPGAVVRRKTLCAGAEATPGSLVSLGSKEVSFGYRETTRPVGQCGEGRGRGPKPQRLRRPSTGGGVQGLAPTSRDTAPPPGTYFAHAFQPKAWGEL